MLIRADIPIFKLKNREFTDFLEKYTGQQIPDESTIQKNYVSIIYEETLKSIRQFIQYGFQLMNRQMQRAGILVM